MPLNPLLKGTFYFTTYGRSPGREGNEEGDRGLSIQLIRNLSQTDCEGHIVPREAARGSREESRMQKEEGCSPCSPRLSRRFARRETKWNALAPFALRKNSVCMKNSTLSFNGKKRRKKKKEITHRGALHLPNSRSSLPATEINSESHSFGKNCVRIYYSTNCISSNETRE